jgi:iron complex transport system permease protein
MILRPPPLVLACLLATLLVPAALLLGLLSGSSGWGWPNADILWLIRMPRVLAAFGTGAALALSGALIQLVTRNPLGDPHVLGVTSGASVGALLALLLLPEGFWLGPEIGAMLGALASMTLVFSLAWRSMGRGLAPSAQPGTVVVLLVGVMVGAACSAAVSFMLAVANDFQLRNIVFWLLGDLNGASIWWPVWLAVAVSFAMAWPRAQELDWLARGDAWAWSLGVPVARRRRVAILAACIATGVAVATAGSIGFVGLVAPHVVRLTGLRSARLLLPFAALFGGVFLVLADTVARTIISPAQLPVGVISAAVGVPLFLMLLLRRRA